MPSRALLPCFVLSTFAACSVSRLEPGGVATVAKADAGRPCADAGTVLDDHPCACPTDCAAGATCTAEANTGIAGGTCLRTCLVPDAGMAVASACTANAVCADFGESLGGCAQRCTTADGCPRGRLCADGICLAFCTADDQCDSRRCRSNRCVTEEPTKLGAFEPCLRDDDCGSLTCTTAWRRCAQYCSMARQDCPAGFACVADDETSLDLGQCMPDCQVSRSCADPNLVCQWAGRPYGKYVCTPRRAPPCVGAPLTTSIGGPCGCDFDCTVEGFCNEESSTGEPGGFCVDRCRTTADCPAAFVCTGATPTSMGRCRLRCASDSMCGRGRYCVNGGCYSFCNSDADCSGGRLCSPHTNRCVATLPTGSPTGAACRTGAECKSGFCSDEGGRGVCIQACKIAEQTCPDGTTCLGDMAGENSGLCYPPCTVGTPCDDPSMDCLPSVFPTGLGTFCRYP